MGYVIEFGKWKIYHSGDTLWFDEMVDILKPFNADIALLPINGNDPFPPRMPLLDCGSPKMKSSIIRCPGRLVVE